jgi:hypothetical protein
MRKTRIRSIKTNQNTYGGAILQKLGRKKEEVENRWRPTDILYYMETQYISAEPHAIPLIYSVQ